MAHPKHQYVRERFNYHCGYCGVSEVDAGGELTVDHYQPVSAHGDDSDTNLVYACVRCNLYKSDYWPTPQEAAAGLRVLHPLRDDLALHLRENVSGHLEALTDSGRAHLSILKLNRSQLVAYRLREKATQQQIAERVLFLMVIQVQSRMLLESKAYMQSLAEDEKGENPEAGT